MMLEKLTALEVDLELLNEQFTADPSRYLSYLPPGEALDIVHRLVKVVKMLDQYDLPREMENVDVRDLAGGNFDDAFSSGEYNGCCKIAKELRNILGIEQPTNIDDLDENGDFDLDEDSYLANESTLEYDL